MQSYKYDNLINDRDIRLLELQPHTKGSGLAGTLRVASLDDCGAYNALSYVWGDATLREPFTCSGGRLMITTNLHAALSQFQQDGRLEPLWVNAICINQENVAERSSQIHLMGEIYRKADCTLLWLGPQSEDDNEAIEAMKWLSEYLQSIPEFQNNTLEAVNWQVVAAGFMNSYDQWDPDGIKVTHIARLLARPWFLRVWAAEEVAKAKRVEVFCGHQNLAFDAFSNAATAFIRIGMIDLSHSHDIDDPALATKTIQWINLCQESIAAWKIKPSETVAKIAEHLSENSVAWSVTAAEKSLDPGYAKDIVITGDDTLKDEAPLGDTRPWTSRTAVVQPTLTGQAEQEEEQQEPLLNNRPQLVTWKCSCGEQLHDYYTERVPGSAKELQQRLRQENAFPSGFWQALWNDFVAWSASTPSAKHGNSDKQVSTSYNTKTTQVVQENDVGKSKEILDDAGAGLAARARPLPNSIDTSDALELPQIHPAVSYLLLCFPEGLSGLRLHHQQILHTAGQHASPNQVTNDRQLFHLLRAKYASKRRLFMYKFWPKTVIRVSLAYFLVDLCEYVELRHYACQDCQPNCRCIPPPDMIQPATNAQYYCVPSDPPLKPPITTNYLTHYFQNPDCIKSDALVGTLNQVPKRLGQCMATSGSQKVEAWGMEFEEGWDRGRLRNAIFGIFVTVCLLFAILWSVLLKDVQSAFSISSFFMAILAIIGGYVASAEPRIVHK